MSLLPKLRLLKSVNLSELQFILLMNLFFSLVMNWAFIGELTKTYPLSFSNLAFILSLQIVLFCAQFIFLNLLRCTRLLKPIALFLILVSAMAAYSMDHFGIIIDQVMLLNLFSTYSEEAIGLITPSFLVYFFFLGIVPSLIILLIKVRPLSWKLRSLSIIKSFGASIVMMGLLILIFNKNYASFFRQHKYIRYYTNPLTWVYSGVKFVRKNYFTRTYEFKELGDDSEVVHVTKAPGREVVILVVGETVRGDHLSLNGYERDTFPKLAKEDVVSFNNFYSCGTSTAISVPCMFSLEGRGGFDVNEARNESNILDFLEKSDQVKVLWRDNNSDSKGVAERIEYEDYKQSKLNTICDVECRDEGMLVGLEERIKAHPEKDILIVLHQMGNHGPAYFERYPKEFEVFKPACHSRELQKCTNEEIVNAYDNALIYTDHFLSKAIELLKKFEGDETALIYVSDHGESLGENGVYLHGMPFMFAPDAQKHVGFISWFGGTFKGRVDYEKLRAKSTNGFTHDNIPHTLLGLFEVKTKSYIEKLDIFDGIIKPD